MKVPHSCPDGYSYEYEKNYKRNITRIWVRNSYEFLYNNGEPTKTVWGFYDNKKEKFYAPINSKQIGKEVQLQNTRWATAMPLNLNPLMSAFQ